MNTVLVVGGVLGVVLAFGLWTCLVNSPGGERGDLNIKLWIGGVYIFAVICAACFVYGLPIGGLWSWLLVGCCSLFFYGLVEASPPFDGFEKMVTSEMVITVLFVGLLWPLGLVFGVAMIVVTKKYSSSQELPG